MPTFMSVAPLLVVVVMDRTDGQPTTCTVARVGGVVVTRTKFRDHAKASDINSKASDIDPKADPRSHPLRPYLNYISSWYKRFGPISEQGRCVFAQRDILQPPSQLLEDNMKALAYQNFEKYQTKYTKVVKTHGFGYWTSETTELLHPSDDMMDNVANASSSLQDGKSEGYNFVQFESGESTNAAIEKLNGSTINDQQIYAGKKLSKMDPSTYSAPPRPL
ncbi:RNA-binding domain superfamily [Sesbania bispinosa]|nr:RNA-binding domain superfamily [Sesbania bispinosa]